MCHVGKPEHDDGRRILSERLDRITFVTLERPLARNSLSPKMLFRLAGHREEVRDDADIDGATVGGAREDVLFGREACGTNPPGPSATGLPCTAAQGKAMPCR